MSNKRDSQRSAVYAWGTRLVERWPGLGAALPHDRIIDLVRRVWNDYHPGRVPPNVRFGTGNARNAHGGRWAIYLPRWACTPKTVLHELAHSLLDGIEPAHGPTFARTMLDLLVEYGDCPSKAEARALGVNQKPRRVRFASPTAYGVPQAPSAAWRAWNAEKIRLAALLDAHKRNEPPRVVEALLPPARFKVVRPTRRCLCGRTFFAGGEYTACGKCRKVAAAATGTTSAEATT